MKLRFKLVSQALVLALVLGGLAVATAAPSGHGTPSVQMWEPIPGTGTWCLRVCLRRMGGSKASVCHPVTASAIIHAAAGDYSPIDPVEVEEGEPYFDGTYWWKDSYYMECESIAIGDSITITLSFVDACGQPRTVTRTRTATL